jgi:hypothetical protein
MVMNIPKNRWLVLTGMLGLLAAILVGTGEFLLHYDPLARFSENGYEFMQAASNQRQTVGHFFGVFGAPLYLIGCWHIYLMLKPANQKLAKSVVFCRLDCGIFHCSDWNSFGADQW